MTRMLLASLFALLLAAPSPLDAASTSGGLALSVQGTCPGTLTLDVTGATPSNRVGFLHGPSGTIQRAQPPCPGIMLPLARITVGTVRISDVNGEVQLAIQARPSFCGRTVVAVDLATCAVSNAVTL